MTYPLPLKSVQQREAICADIKTHHDDVKGTRKFVADALLRQLVLHQAASSALFEMKR